MLSLFHVETRDRVAIQSWIAFFCAVTMVLAIVSGVATQ